MEENPTETLGRRQALFLLALVLLPGFLNDFAFLAAKTAPQWLAADYSSRLVTLGVIALVPAFRRYILASFRLPRRILESLGLAALCVGAIVAVDLVVTAPLDAAFPQTKLVTFPAINSTFLYRLDMTFGLALVAVSEEVAYRGVTRQVIGRFANRAVLILVSSLVFALIHWSSGLGTIATAFIAGVILMALFLRTGSLVPPIVAHYAVDAILFA